MYGDYLYHYGVQGQKHGERRYQNEDGSLTPLGREHYGVGPARTGGSAPKVVVKTKAQKRVETAAARKTTKEQSDAEKAAKREAKAAKTKEDVLRSGDYNTIMKYRKQLTDSELKAALSRLQTEAELAKFAPKKPEKAKKLTESGKAVTQQIFKELGEGALKGAGKAATVVVGAVALKAGKDLVMKLVGGDKDKYNAIFDEDVMKQLLSNLAQKK